MFASVVSCLGWDSVGSSFWLGPASFYACTLLSLGSIFTAAQQTTILPDHETVSQYGPEQIATLKKSLLNETDDYPRYTVMFAWQCPIMLLGYSVIFFLIGMTTILITPLAIQPEWGSAAKVKLVDFC